MSATPAPIGSVPGVEFASLGRRLLAALIDGLFWIIGGPFLIGWIPVDPDSTGAALIGLAYLVVAFNYFAVCEWRFGQTIGKNATGIRVVRLDRGRMTWNTAAIRNLMRLIDLPLMLIGVGALMIERSPRRQRLGDRAAGTVVVRDREPEPAPATGEVPRAGGAEWDGPAEHPPGSAGRWAPFGDRTRAPSRFPFATWGARRAAAGALIGLAGGALIAPLLVLPFDPDLATDNPTVGGLLVAQALLEISLVGAALWVAYGVGDPRPSLRAALERLGVRGFGASAFKWLGLGMLAYYTLTIAYGALVIEPKQEDVARDLGLDAGVAGAVGAVLLIAIAAPIAEELFFRGMLFGGLRQRFPRLTAALISGAVFGAVHATTGVTAIPPLIVFGVVLALVYERTDSLLPGMIGHAFNNALALALTA